MCGRFFIAPEANLQNALMAKGQALDLSIKFYGEIFPTDIVPVFTLEKGRRLARPMIWGFPGWQGKGVVFNARQETALEKPMFKKSLLERRVATLTSGFYEWKAVPGQKKKDRFIFTLGGVGYLFLAGFWNSYVDQPKGNVTERFTVLTTEANESMAPYHSRMPVILTDDEVDDWLGGSDLEKYLKRPQAEVRAEKA
ncbi:MAG: SOS response-associated peptidase [Deltaproteobacteria bacterium]|jgi:putative SOS response-associated peptidase YedK|nr:SOS response-associated peptidase [Deltaproteobacteria bacterium]